jgi:hypothetical protein
MIRLIDEQGERIISQSEYDSIIASKNRWTLESHKKDLLTQHTEHFENIVTSLDYENINDVSITGLVINDFQEEALSLAKYWTSTYKELLNYFETQPTEQTKKELLEIISLYGDI